MTFKAIMFMLGVTEQYSIDVFHMVLALWFFSVGYLLYKRANRALCQQRRTKLVVDVPQAEVPCLTAGTYRTTGA
jgi:hypothetical protein